jgi:Tfp pilus assembly protein PilN
MLSIKTALEMLRTSSSQVMLKTNNALKMLRTKTALGIDISDKRISLVLLKSDKNGVKLLASASAPVPDGAIKNGNIEDARVLAKAIKELKTRNKIRTQPTALSFVVNPVLIQILDLPKGVPANIGQFVRNEVKQCAKLPIKDVAVDFCGIKSSVRLGNRRALVVATDNQKITQVAKILASEGLNIDAIEPASVAYIRACYEKKIAKKFGRNLLFAIVREGILTLCLFRNQALDFVRTKQFEADKCNPDKYPKWLAGEIYEVLRFYELEVLDKRDKWEVILTTDIHNEYIKDNIKALAADIEAVELEVRTPEDAYLDTPVADTNLPDKPSAVAVGLAMKLLGTNACSLGVNLLPPEVTRLRAARKGALITANIVAAVLLIMILVVNGQAWKIEKINESINRKEAHLLQDTHTLVKERVSVNEQINTMSNKLNRINKILGSHRDVDWPGLLNDIGKGIPKTACITSLSSGADSRMSLGGLALSNEAVYLFVDMLNKSEHIDSASIVKTGKDNKGFISYEISCTLFPRKGKQ